MTFNLIHFIAESNRIEGLFHPVKAAEIVAHETLLALGAITISDLESFLARMQPDAVLRAKTGLNVTVGEHMPLPGGPAIPLALQKLLDALNGGTMDPYNFHARFETLHPFSDGNGRSGRAIWLWHFYHFEGGYPTLSFLHWHYYASLSAYRVPR